MDEECRRDRDGYCWTCQADYVDRCPKDLLDIPAWLLDPQRPLLREDK